MSKDSKHPGDVVQELLNRHQRQLHFFIFGICPNHEATEDILQETKHVIWSKRTEFEPGSNFLAWARTIAKYQTLKYFKSNSSKAWLQFDTSLVEDLATEIGERSSKQQDRNAHHAADGFGCTKL